MKVAFYVGDHAGAPLFARIGAWLTRLAQKGPYGDVTHGEAVLEEHGDGLYTIASSVTKEGVRILERVPLDPAQWLIVDVPQWDAVKARAWFESHAGEPYDWRGAWATVMPGHAKGGRRFCSASVLASVGWKTPDNFTPAHLAAIAYSLAGLAGSHCAVVVGGGSCGERTATLASGCASS